MFIHNRYPVCPSTLFSFAGIAVPILLVLALQLLAARSLPLRPTHPPGGPSGPL